MANVGTRVLLKGPLISFQQSPSTLPIDSALSVLLFQSSDAFVPESKVKVRRICDEDNTYNNPGVQK